MITIARDGERFNLRAAAVCIVNGHALLHRAVHDTFWALPGGRVEMGEESRVAVVRELGEELGDLATGTRAERLLWVVENFFSLNGWAEHEIGIYYLVTIDPASPLLNTEVEHPGVEDMGGNAPGERAIKLIYKWFPLATLADVPLYPTFLRTRLSSLPEQPEHIVHHDHDKV